MTQKLKSMLKLLSNRHKDVFNVDLDKTLLLHIIDGEIKRRKEEFIKSELTNSNLNLLEILALKTYVNAPESINDDSISQAINKKEPTSSNLSEQEKLEKRRAYARAYYLKKKTGKTASPSGKKKAKKFKTTPEQRLYQKAYYQRKKKAEAEEAKRTVQTPLFSDEQKNIKEKTRASHYETDFNSLSSNRNAIEEAFNAAFGSNSSNWAIDSSSSKKQAPRTKLRKNKS